MDRKSRGIYIAPAAESNAMPRPTVALPRLVDTDALPEHATQTRPSRRRLSHVPAVPGHFRSRAANDAAFDEQASNVPISIDDNLSTIGNWYLAEFANIQTSDPRAEVHRVWGLALWDTAKSDATLFGCVALLTLHKKRSIASRFDKVLYLDHKQRVYESLCQTVASSGGNVAGITALAIALLAFAEVQEGNFQDARRHINAVAVMDCVCRLDEVQWRLVVWNDLRYAMKSATLPTLRYYMPPSLTDALSQIDGSVTVEARRLALSNWKHLKKYPDLEKGVWFQLLISLHIVSIVANSRTSAIQHADLATAYEAEYQAHTIAANLATQIEPKETSVIANVLIIACQLHILATTSGFAPSTVELRETLLDKARSGLLKSNIGNDAEQAWTHDPALLWVMSTFATHSMDGGFQHTKYQVYGRKFLSLAGVAGDASQLKSPQGTSDKKARNTMLVFYCSTGLESLSLAAGELNENRFFMLAVLRSFEW